MHQSGPVNQPNDVSHAKKKKRKKEKKTVVNLPNKALTPLEFWVSEFGVDFVHKKLYKKNQVYNKQKASSFSS